MNPTMRVRIALVIVGSGILGFSVILGLTQLRPDWILGIGLWLAAALVIHDGVIAMAVFAVAILGRRAARRVPYTVVLLVQGAAAIGAIVIALVVPEIIKRALGTANPSVLPLDYVGNLLAFLAVLMSLVALSSVGTVILSLRRRRRATRTP